MLNILYISRAVPALLLWAGATLSAQLPKEVVRIPGSANPHPLPPIADIEVNENGLAFVLHPTEQTISVYDSDGRLVGRIGREGSGPGEFRFPAQAQSIDDTISIWDPALRRLSWFNGEREFIRSISLNVGGLVFPLNNHEFLAEANPRNSTSATIILVDSTGNHLRTIDSIDQSNRVLVLGAQGREFQSLQPFADHELWAVDPQRGRIALVNRSLNGARKELFNVTLVSAFGDTAFSTTVRHQPIPLTQEIIKDAARKLYSSSTLGFPQQQIGVSEAQIEAQMYKPAFLPAVSSVVVSSSGEIWLGLAPLCQYEVRHDPVGV